MRVNEMCDIKNACVKCNDKLIKYKANNTPSLFYLKTLIKFNVYLSEPTI